MVITIKQKKLIFIILSLTLLVFIFVYGVDVYRREKIDLAYNARINKIMKPAQLESKNCIESNIEETYRICCRITKGIKKGLLYDCTDDQYFESGQHIYMILNVSKMNIPFNPFFMHIYSDLINSNVDEYNVVNEYGKIPIDKDGVSEMYITGQMPQEDGPLILLKLSAYPSNTFDSTEEEILIYREANIMKE